MKNYLMIALAWLGMVTSSGCKVKENKDVKVITPSEFAQCLAADSAGVLLDVRKPDEYAEGHLKGAVLMNWLDRSAFEEAAKRLDKGKTIYVYCRSGRRSNEAANYLANLGYKVVDMQGGYLAWAQAGLSVVTFDTDLFTTGKGRQVAITFIKHATLMLQVDGYTIFIDPVKMFGTDFTKLPMADLLLVTHEHADHYDPMAISEVLQPTTQFVSNGRVAQLSGKSQPMKIGEKLSLPQSGITLTATAAYNSTPNRQQFHPKGRDVGFLIDIDDLRIYVSGDTEDISELAELKDVDIAFLSVNQPYTMTPQQCIHAIEMVKPAVVYPYHYSETNLAPIVERFANDNKIDVRVRQMQ